MDSGKGRQVIYVAAQFSGIPEAFIKLGKTDSQLIEMIFAQEVDNYVRFWKQADDEKFLDAAYDHHFGPLGRLPPKNLVPYQVITDDEYSKLVNPREYVTKYYYDLTEEGRKQIHEETKKNKEVADGLAEVDDCLYLCEDGKIELINASAWLAKNFTLRLVRVAGLFALACKKGGVALAQTIYKSYETSLPIGWTALFRRYSGEMKEWHPFYLSMVEDRSKTAMWLADTFDFSAWMKSHEAHFLIGELFWLNNVTAVQWLIEKYDIPQEVTFFYPGVHPEIILWLMREYGRGELAKYLSDHYKIQAAEPVDFERAKYYSPPYLLQPPPPTTRRSEAIALENASQKTKKL